MLSLVIAISIVLPCFSESTQKSNITNAKTPTCAEYAELKWSLKLGTSYKDAPSVMTIVDDTILVMAGKNLYKLNKKNGSIISCVQTVAAPSYGTVPVTYANGVIYCPLGSGHIQAFSYETMESLWVYKDEIGGQALTAIKYDNGFIYTGFWKSEDKYANFVCIDVTDEKPTETHEAKAAKWTYKSQGGFYWAGCETIGDCVVFGCDDGTEDYTNPSKVISVNKNNGNVIDSLDITGDQRTGFTFEGGKLFFATKAGWLYSVKTGKDGKFVRTSLKKLNLGSSATATPVIYNNRLYIGTQGAQVGMGYIKVINAETLKVIYSVKMKGYPQSPVLVSDAYFSDNQSVYVYSTYNSFPGGISFFIDRENTKNAVAEDLFIPSDDKAEYSISTIVADSDGTLFYKNDSGYIFAVANTENYTSMQRFLRKLLSFIMNVIRKYVNGI